MSDLATQIVPVRRLEMHRRVALIRPDSIMIQPSRRALRGPAFAFLTGALALILIAIGRSTLPLPLLTLLLLLGVFLVPFGGMGVVYGLIGAHVVIDRTKQSATWQQGMIGLGIGTEELVPFDKIAAIVVAEAGTGETGSGARTEEFAQWQVLLEKTSGRHLVIGGVTAARSLSTSALTRAAEVAEAIAALTGAPVRLPGQMPPAATRAASPGPGVRGTPARPPQRRNRRKRKR